jgi:[ribosomal protein S5]-alanine N-acetyltransferase
MELFTPRLKLRELVETDFLALREMETRPEFNTYEREFTSEGETRKSLEESLYSQHEISRTIYRLAIAITPQDTTKGILKLSRHQESIREWEVGWAMHPDEWGKGFATEAAWHLIDWAFRELNIHRVVGFCHASNAASVRVMEKLGMHQEGRLKDARWLNDAWWDEYVYAVVERDWMDNKDWRGLR